MLAADFTGAVLNIFLIKADYCPLRKWMGGTGKSNPYCKFVHMAFAGDGAMKRLKFKSRVLRNSVEPVWKEHIAIPLKCLIKDEVG